MNAPATSRTADLGGAFAESGGAETPEQLVRARPWQAAVRRFDARDRPLTVDGMATIDAAEVLAGRAPTGGLAADAENPR